MKGYIDNLSFLANTRVNKATEETCTELLINPLKSNTFATELFPVNFFLSAEKMNTRNQILSNGIHLAYRCPQNLQ